ncbi:PREDICTED: tetraspanin-16 [Cyprinodon variegatus]|uniref:tetraspanin-16 n=1 Tax=Cyprinodon variegatus TaxID=28743 RepID=UPI0007427AB5|nr:PREDICTED: tetraspanin-16 [Cyprinodon variegatus]
MGCFGFLKGMMFVFNGIIFLAGIAILGVGIWVKVDSGSIFNFLEEIEDVPPEINQVLNVGYLLIAIGGVLVIIGFLGCCGAIRESKCMLMLFFIIILLVFIAEVAGAVVLLVFQPLAGEILQKFGDEVVKNIKDQYGKNEDITGLWNSTMDTLQCCGFYNYTDFKGSPYNNQGNKYPTQCCQSDLPCIEATAMLKNIDGCFHKIEKLISENTNVIVAVGLGIAALEVCAMIVSMILYCKIKS